MQLRHTVGARALVANHGDEIAFQLTGLEGFHDLFLRIEYQRRRAHHLVLGLDRGYLDYRAAEIALQQLQAAAVGKGLRTRAQDSLVAAVLGRRPPGEFAAIEPGFLAVAPEPRPGDGLHVCMQQPGIEQFANQQAHAAGGMKLVDVGGTVRVNARQQRHRGR